MDVNVDIFSDFLTGDDISNISEKEQESRVTNPTECWPQKLKKPKIAPSSKEASSAVVHVPVTPALSSIDLVLCLKLRCFGLPKWLLPWLPHCKCQCVCFAAKSL